MLATWPLSPAVALGLLGAGLLYVEADRRVRTRAAVHAARARRRFFMAGLAVIFVALQSPLDVQATRWLSLHMVQHLLLTMVAAPLLVLGAPVTLALRTASPRARGWLLAALRSFPVRLLSNPLVAWSLFFFVLWASHFTSLYEAALRSDAVHEMEHVAYLVSALLFWSPVVGTDPSPSRLSHPAKVLYLFLSMPPMAFLGLAIFSAGHVLYPTYAALEGAARALADQRAAGALMWTGTMFLIVPALAFVLLDWMRADERDARRADAVLAGVTRGDTVLKPRAEPAGESLS
jgi:putative copper resistance protein D